MNTYLILTIIVIIVILLTQGCADGVGQKHRQSSGSSDTSSDALRGNKEEKGSDGGCISACSF